MNVSRFGATCGLILAMAMLSLGFPVVRAAEVGTGSAGARDVASAGRSSAGPTGGAGSDVRCHSACACIAGARNRNISHQ